MGKVSGRFEAWFQANPKAAEWVDGWLAARAAGEDVRGTRGALAVLRDEFGCPFGQKSQPAFLNWLKRYRSTAWAAAANAPKLASKVRSEAAAEFRAKARAAVAEPKTDAELLAEDRARAAERRQGREAGRIIRELERELRDTKERNAFLDALAAAPDPRPYEVTKLKGRARDTRLRRS